MRSGEKKKLIAAGVLLAVALVWVYLALSPSSSSASTPPPDAASRRQNTLNSLAKGDPTTSSAGPAKDKGRNLTGALSIDPVLRLDLLAKAQTIKYEGSDRNIFQFYTAPPPPLPVPVRTPITGPNNAAKGPDGPPPVAPPPAIPLKYYGVVTTIGASTKKACLQDGDDIFVAGEGDMVKKRYRVVRINDLGSDHSVEMEDTQSSAKTKIPLQEGGDKS